MSAKKSADAWFAAYGESHHHPTNELIHWICVPLIFWSILGLSWSLPVPEWLFDRAPWFNWCLVAILLAHLFYVRLSVPLSVGLLFFMAVCYASLALLDLYLPWPLGWLCAGVFVLAWLGQFIGHRIEGQKPYFFQDISFLLIGPAWLMGFVYKRLGQSY